MIKHCIYLLRSLILIYGFLHTGVAFAWYQVEVIVFKHASANLNYEVLRQDNIQPIKNKVSLKDTSNNALTPYQIMPATQHKMNNIYATLKRLAYYQPLLHVAWQQPTKNKASYVHLYQDKASITPDQLTTDPINRILDGSIRIRSRQLLYIDVNMRYLIQNINGELNYAYLVETRNVKLNELHYFDHPLYGIIVYVARLTQN